MKIVAKQNTLLERYARRRRRLVGVMKIVAKQNTRIARRMIDWRYALALISGLMIGIAYCHAAQRDERDGYTITAALEWRRAAELMAPVPTAADRCWLQWERIMHLPRRLAGPVSASLDITLAA
jgi:hypothetical protein